jgi:PAS domain S-box-containing protein
MVGTYDIWLVVLSIVVAIVASYVALDLASRVVASHGRTARSYWLAGGAVSMGTGIWSMHFIGMLAFRLPIPMSYDVPTTLLSLLIAVMASAFALYLVSRGKLTLRRLVGGGVLMGIGILSMHYTGMAAMQMAPPIHYQPLLLCLSVLIGIVASTIALWSAFELRFETILSAFWKRVGSAFVMGSAISGMHYTGMAAAIFAPDSICTVNPQNINNSWLAGTVGGFSLLFLAATLLISTLDAYLADLSAKYAEVLRGLNAELGKQTAELARTNVFLDQEVRTRSEAEEALRKAHAALETRVAERTVELARSNESLMDQIAALKAAETRIREGEIRLQVFMDNSPSVMFIKDLDGRYIHANKQFQKSFGLTERQIPGKTDLEIFPHELATEYRANDRKVIESGVTQEFEETARYVDRDRVSITNKFPIRDAAGVIVALGGVATDITDHRRAEQDLKMYADQLQSLSRRLVETQENYRHELSRELHDRVGQNLTALNINLDIVLNSLPASLKPKLGPRLMDSLALVISTADAIEDVMLELRPPMLDDYGLLTALRWLSKQFSQRTGIRAALKDSGQLERMDSAAEVALYRMVQEALTNVAKHADAKQVDITVTGSAGNISLTVIDNGIGFDSASMDRFSTRTGWGIISMRERAQAVGGTLTIESAPGKGTRVIVIVPR